MSESCCPTGGGAQGNVMILACSGGSNVGQLSNQAAKGDVYEPFSAGVNPKGLDPRAVKAMAEAGIDIRGQRSKSVEDLPVQDFAYVVTLCSHAQESCPYFPASVKRLHIPL